MVLLTVLFQIEKRQSNAGKAFEALCELLRGPSLHSLRLNSSLEVACHWQGDFLSRADAPLKMSIPPARHFLVKALRVKRSLCTELQRGFYYE